MKFTPTPNNMYGDHSCEGEDSVSATAAPQCCFICIMMAVRGIRWAGHVARIGRREMGTEFQ